MPNLQRTVASLIVTMHSLWATPTPRCEQSHVALPIKGSGAQHGRKNPAHQTSNLVALTSKQPLCCSSSMWTENRAAHRCTSIRRERESGRLLALEQTDHGHTYNRNTESRISFVFQSFCLFSTQ